MTATLPFDRIQDRRESLGLSQKELCRRADLNESTLANAKRNGGALALETIAKFAAVLGCTLAELRGEEPAAAAVAAPGVQLIDFTHICPSPLNPRKTFEAEALADLANSIQVQGLLQNLVVRPQEPEGSGDYWIVAGERRFRALEILAANGRFPASLAAGIPCRVIEADDAGHLALSLLENLQRKDVNPMEEAEALSRLVGLGWGTAEIAAKIGATQRHIQQRIALTQRLAPEAQTALKSGKINFTQARALILAKPKEQADLLKRIKDFPTAEAIRNRATAGMILADNARFKHAEYLGEILEADDGKKYFPDREAFFAAQRQAASSLAATLSAKPGVAFVEVEESNWFSTWEYPEAKGDAPRGVVLHIDQTSGALTEYHDRMKRPEPQADPAEAARRAAEAAEEKRQAEENKVFFAALAAKVATRSDIALALLLLSFDRSVYAPPQECAGILLSIHNGSGLYANTDDWITAVRSAAAIPTREAGRIIAARLNLVEHRIPAMLIAAADILGVPVPAHLRPQPDDAPANPVRDDAADEAAEDEDEEFEGDGLDLGVEPWMTPIRSTSCPDDIA